jgi:hypothetical protein
MILRSLTEHENQICVVPGMDCRHPDSQGCIPALHAGMTQSRGSAKIFSSFVLFECFVVISGFLLVAPQLPWDLRGEEVLPDDWLASK